MAGNRIGCLALMTPAHARTGIGIGWAIVIAAATAGREINTGGVFGTARFAGSTCRCAGAALAGETIPAIGAIEQWGVDTDVALAGNRIAELGGAIVDVAAATVRVIAGVATGATDGTVRTTRTTGIIRADLLDRATLLFGHADSASIAARAVTTLLGSLTAGGPAEKPGWTGAFGSVPSLDTGAFDGFGGRFGTPRGVSRPIDPAERWKRGGTQAQQSIQKSATAPAAGERFGQPIEPSIVHASFSSSR